MKVGDTIRIKTQQNETIGISNIKIIDGKAVYVQPKVIVAETSVTVKNVSAELVTIELDDGQVWHIPPDELREVMLG